MNLIIFRRKDSSPRHIELSRSLVLGAAAACVLTIASVAFFLGARWGANGAEVRPGQQTAAWSQQIKEQKAEIAELRQNLQDNVDALARRVGLMSAHVIRLNTLGRRLTQMADIDEREFNFTRAPAQGGPEEASDSATPASGQAQIPELTAMIDRVSQDLQDREVQLGVLESLLLSRKLNEQIRPAGRPTDTGWISSYFGTRADPFTGYSATHKGVDFAGREGSEVKAVAAGVVTWARDRYGYGKLVEINHGNGYSTRYAHNSRVLVAIGDTVRKGQPIALMGSSGRSTGPHVHFEVLKGGQQVNPLKFIGE